MQTMRAVISRPNQLAGTAVAVAFVLGQILISGLGSLAAQETETPPREDRAGAVLDEDGNPIDNPFPNRPKAPKGILQGGREWLNASGEITLDDLRGKVVLLDFWTFCCINCMHVLPDLKFLEEKYPDELVVIGVHSAKFENEKDSESIRRAIQRYEIEHPVINDADMIVWRKFGTRAWPTLALIDPEGHYIGSQSGEGNRELFDQVIGKLIAYHKAKGTLDTTPVRFDLEADKLPPAALRFPGKVLADPVGRRIFIADSNHNRIVIAGLDGTLRAIVGDGQIGARDGSLTEARFFRPQGMTLVDDQLYVADTENHLIRRIDLANRQVSTVAGTGQQAKTRLPGGPVSSTALNSPWALDHVNGTLYICMAGPHQIWSHVLGSDTIQVYAGSGREDVLNGRLSASAFAQPSGIVHDSQFLYVVDSEGSAVRNVPLAQDGKVGTIAGTSELPRGQSLFAFGDVDGIGDEARLQHPLGIAISGKTLYVADSYNHKVKRIDLETQRCETWLGTGSRGTALDPLEVAEPGGLSIAGGKLYIADTNNHRIVQVELETQKATEFQIAGLQPPERPSDAGSTVTSAVDFARVEEVSIAAALPLNITIQLQLPLAHKLAPEAPVEFRVQSDAALIDAAFQSQAHRADVQDGAVQLTLPVSANEAGSYQIRLSLTYAYCREGVGGLCKLQTDGWQIPVNVDPESKNTSLSLTAPAAP